VKKGISIFLIVCCALYLFMCITIYIPEKGFSYVATDIVVCLGILAVSIAVLSKSFISESKEESFNPKKRKPRAGAVNKGLCPSCFRPLSPVGTSTYNFMCHTCDVDVTKTHTVKSNYFVEDEPTKVWTEEFATHLSWVTVSGDPVDDERATRRRVSKKVSEILDATVEALEPKVVIRPINENDEHTKTVIENAKKIINNICPICGEKIVIYSNPGTVSHSVKATATGYNEITLTRQANVTGRYTRITCPNKHGSYYMSSYEADGYFYKSVSVTDRARADFEITEAVDLISTVKSKVKYWPELEKRYVGSDPLDQWFI